MDVNKILEQFIKTLPKQKQKEFLQEFQELSPEEQQEFVGTLAQQMQAPQVQPMKKGGKVKSDAGFLEDYLSKMSEEEQDLFISQLESMSPQERTNSIQYMKCGGKLQMGGQTHLPVEVEGGETLYTPDQELQKFEGPKHSEGGIDVVLPEGSKIFSEHLKVPNEIYETVFNKKTSGKKKSFADLSKRFPTEPHQKVLEDPNADEYAKQTALYSLERNKANLNLLFEAQEGMKASKEKGSMKYGGKLYAQAGMFVAGKNYDLSGISGEFQTAGEFAWDPTSGAVFKRNQDGTYALTGESEPQEFSKQQQEAKRMAKNILDSKNQAIRESYNPNLQKETGLWDSLKGIFGESSSTGAFDNGQVGGGGSGGDWEDGPSMVPTGRDKFPIVPPLPTDIAPVKRPPIEGAPESVTVPTRPKVTIPTPIPSGSSHRTPLQVTSQRGAPELEVPVAQTQEEAAKKKRYYGIDDKLAGTALDIMAVMSDRVKVDGPQYRDNRKYPLFSRYVDFEDKTAAKMLDKSIQQIQNSTMPSQVKQSMIANAQAQFADQQGQHDMQNAQRYEAKIQGDTQKLQTYLDSNVDQATQDIDTYRQKKAQVEYLRDQFKAKRKEQIVNSARKYFDYVGQVNKMNQIYSDNYDYNPITGRVVFEGSKQDPLKMTDDQMSQYVQAGKNQISLPNGASMTMLNANVGILTDKDGKSQYIDLSKGQGQGQSKPQSGQNPWGL